METSTAPSFAPRWVVDMVKSQSNVPKISDSPSTVVAKLERAPGGVPQQEYLQSFPDNIPNTEPYQRQLAQEANAKLRAYMQAANAAADNRFAATYSQAGQTRMSMWA